MPYDGFDSTHESNTITDGDCWEVIVVGGGPAGLSAALILARANRRVLVFDSGPKRNEASERQHAVLGADGENQRDFISRARQQVLAYPTAEFHCSAVVEINIEATRTEGTGNTRLKQNEKILETRKFDVTTEADRRWRSQKLILATGVKDDIPDVQGFQEYWGQGVWVCLYCNGYEYNGRKLAAYGNAARGIHLAFEMV